MQADLPGCLPVLAWGGALVLASFISKGLRDSRRGVRCSRLKILNISIITVNGSRIKVSRSSQKFWAAGSGWACLMGSLLIWPSAPCQVTTPHSALHNYLQYLPLLIIIILLVGMAHFAVLGGWRHSRQSTRWGTDLYNKNELGKFCNSGYFSCLQQCNPLEC